MREVKSEGGQEESREYPKTQTKQILYAPNKDKKQTNMQEKQSLYAPTIRKHNTKQTKSLTSVVNI